MNYYKPGTWNVICDVCGVEFKSDEIKKRWDGLLVCSNDYETRHIMDFIRVRSEHSSVPYTRAEPPDNFIPVIYIESGSGQADIGVADLAKADVVISITN